MPTEDGGLGGVVAKDRFFFGCASGQAWVFPSGGRMLPWLGIIRDLQTALGNHPLPVGALKGIPGQVA